MTRSRSRPFCWDVSGGLPVFCPNILRAHCEDVSGWALFSAPLGGAAEGYDTVPFAAVLWGCLKRFACFLSQHLSLGEQMMRMFQAGR
eukprot:6117991-Pyramimonas_sp.AAC.1